MGNKESGFPELRNAADFMPEVLRMMSEPPLVQRVAGGFDVFDRDQGNTYEIDNSPLQSAVDAMFWIRQLGEKNWVTKQHLVEFAQAVISAKDAE